MSRTKGAGGEREFAGLLHDYLGVRLVRNLEQTRSGGHDLVLHPDETGPVADVLEMLAIEVKRYGRITHAVLCGFWAQACEQAEDAGKVPVLACREDRQPWLVVCPMHLLNGDMYAGHELPWCVSMSIEGFCVVIRERAADSRKRRGR